MDRINTERFDVVAFGAHPDDLEVVMGGTAAMLVRSGMSVLFVDLCDGEPARHAIPGVRHDQAQQAATILGVRRVTLPLHDRLIRDSVEARLAVARLIRVHKPRLVFTTAGAGVHPDHSAVTDIVVHGVFYARLPKWDEVNGGDTLDGTEPHEIDRLFFGHCRMEPPWTGFDFAVDVSEIYAQKMAAITGVRVGLQRRPGDARRQVQRRGSVRRQPGRRSIRRSVQGQEPPAGRQPRRLCEGEIRLNCDRTGFPRSIARSLQARDEGANPLFRLALPRLFRSAEHLWMTPLSGRTRSIWTRADIDPSEETTMSFCDHCEGQRYDRARVLRALRATQKRLRKSNADAACSADQTLALAIEAVRGLDIPHLEVFDDVVDGEIVH